MSAIQTQTQAQGRVKPTSMVYWLRFALAVVAGVANQLLHIDQASFGDVAVFVAIILGVFFYLLSVLIVRHVFRFGDVQLKGKNKYITLGGGTFIVVWVLVSVLLYTVYR